MVSAYDGEYGYNIEDDYVQEVTSEKVKPAAVEIVPCTASMIYNDYVDKGYGMN